MTGYELTSVIIAFIALLTSCTAVFFNGVQTKKASEAIRLQQELAKGSVITHFTSQFFELLKEGQLNIKIKEPDWSHRFWSVLSTEFYFFHHSILPSFMFTLWMIDLASLYTEENDGEEIRNSHKEFLDTYSFLYGDMTSFFSELYNIAKDSSHSHERNQKVSEFVEAWYKENKQKSLS